MTRTHKIALVIAATLTLLVGLALFQAARQAASHPDKGALNAATKSLALEVASRGITVNAVAPGIIETAMSASTFDAETIARMVPMKRAGTPQEVADLVGFLASEQAAYITGQIISINGGII